MGRASPGRGAEPTQAPPLSKLEAYLCAAKKHGEYQKMARKPTGVSPAWDGPKIRILPGQRISMEGLGVGVDKARDAWEIYMKFQVRSRREIFRRSSAGGLKV